MVGNEARCFVFIEFEDRNYKVRGQKGQAVIFYSHNLDGQSGILRRFGVGGLNLIWVGGFKYSLLGEDSHFKVIFLKGVFQPSTSN